MPSTLPTSLLELRDSDSLSFPTQDQPISGSPMLPAPVTLSTIHARISESLMRKPHQLTQRTENSGRSTT
ncbi:hypothetical protein PMAYCL1PPCAC_20123 [Pristionchus mayeri]|uniref:Uncharacterized protein n=1 Tax=Pristionchus mayeri TaxID=1317129 RepID=A0AAN5CSL4_9BILA|nr:hypothetical protein PMAYCL1PPCAC_20123 [Pristionchus mayeri]